MDKRGYKEGDGFRNAVISGKQRNIFQAVHDEKREDSRRQRFSQITDVGGKRCTGFEKEKRKRESMEARKQSAMMTHCCQKGSGLIRSLISLSMVYDTVL